MNRKFQKVCRYFVCDISEMTSIGEKLRSGQSPITQFVPMFVFISIL